MLLKQALYLKLKLVANDLNLGLHSMRKWHHLGDTTSAANSAALSNGRCWKSETSEDGYVEDSVESCLSVSKCLGL